MRHFLRYISGLLLAALLISVPVPPASAETPAAATPPAAAATTPTGPVGAPPAPQLEADSALLVDAATGQVLYEKNADAVRAPASLTKLVTMHLALKRLAEGGMKLTDKVEVRPEAWAAKMRESSVMFLEPGQTVTVGEVLKGITVASGNDACIAIAQHMAGGVDAFVKLMNDEMTAMGYKSMHFLDPHGLSSKSTVSARELADFSRKYLEMHPEAPAQYHSLKEFSYPLWENLSPEAKKGVTQATYKPILQYNRNGLLWSFEGTDGLKTGFIDESGYNIVLTAKRGDMRLVGVILGVPGRTTAEGTVRREAAGAALLTYGFQNFVTVKPQLGKVDPVRVWKGTANELTLEPARPLILTVVKGQETKLTPVVHQESSAIAPVKKGDKLGEVVFAADGKEISRVPLVAAADVPQGGFFKRMWDSFRLFLSGLFGKKK